MASSKTTKYNYLIQKLLNHQYQIFLEKKEQKKFEIKIDVCEQEV